MKAIRLKVKNIGILEDITIEINRPLILFYGEVRQGKTTILNAIRWVFGGSFPDDIIRHGEKEASIEFEFEGGNVTRSWYISSKDHTTKAREVEFVREGRIVKRPVAELARFLNPFLLDQDHFRNKGETERKAFLTELFDVDTKDLDGEALELSRKATTLRARIEGYGDLQKTPAPVKPDTAAIQAQIDEVKRKHEADVKLHKDALADRQQKHAEKVGERNRVMTKAAERKFDISRYERMLKEREEEIRRLMAQVEEAKEQSAECVKWLKEHPEMAVPEAPAEPDYSEYHRKINAPANTVELDRALATAEADIVRYEQWEKDQARALQKEEEMKQLSALEHRQREIKKLKVARLGQIAKDSKVEGLAFNEEGDFIYEGTAAGMLSTSQIMRLSNDLSALYPEGLSLDLIDRAESLGKSILDFIERAKSEEKTILATIVGEAPAKVPADVGVFVVEKGKVTPAQTELL